MIQALQPRFGEDVVIVEGYGLTEVTMGATVGPAAVRRSARWARSASRCPTRRSGSRPRRRGRCRRASAGEVCIRGPQVMAGTRTGPRRPRPTLVDGWLHSGDIGVLDEDGYLSIVDRKKDMLIYKGYNVFPRELEETAATRSPGVAGPRSSGRPDPVVGELPVAFVVAPGLDDAAGDSLMEEVNAQVRRTSGSASCISWTSIPVSAAGKVLKRELRERLD